MKQINFNKYINFNFKKYINFKFKKYINFSLNKFKKYKIVLFYFIGFVIFATAIYLSIPMFFDFEKSKKEIVNKIYNDFGLKSSINGKIKYHLLPSPQIKINNLLVKDLIDNSKNLGKVESAILTIPFRRLVSLNKLDFNKLELKNAQIDLNLNQFNQYKKYFIEQFESKNIKISGGHINLSDAENYLSKIDNIDFKYNPSTTIKETTLKGEFLGDNIVINYKNKKKTSSPNILLIRFPNLNFKTNIIFSKPDSENKIKGKSYLFFNKNKISLLFDFAESSIRIKSGNIRNNYLNGKISGKVDFLPFFNFNLDVGLSSLNFKNAARLLIELDSNSINNFFDLNNKINGNLNLNIDKIYSSSKLVKSIESRIQFIDKDILIDRMLIDLGKLGAADIVGLIKNENKNSNFSFRKNLFIDNAKYFYSRFGVYNKTTEPENLFVSGNFNFKNPKIRLEELITDDSLSEEDINFYENEFNQIVLEKGYKTLFDFFKLKEFINLVSSEEN